MPNQHDDPKSMALQVRKKARALSTFLDGRKGEIAKIIPSDRNIERVVKTAILAAMSNPEIIQRCTPSTIYRSVLQACLMDLAVGDGYNEGYLIRYGSACTFRASYLGWMKVACRSPGVDMIRASLVYEKDSLHAVEHPPSIKHESNLIGERGKIVGALAVAYSVKELPDGKIHHAMLDYCFVPRDQIDRARSMGSEKGAWGKWPEEMAKKVAIRRLCKMLPRNEDMGRLQRIEGFADQGVVDVPDPDIDDVDKIVDARFADMTDEPAEYLPEPEIESPKPATSKASKIKKGMKRSAPKPPPAPPPPDGDVVDYGGPDVPPHQEDLEF